MIPEVGNFIKTADLILKPLMWILGGFRLPVQETHAWHTLNVDSTTIDDRKGLALNYPDTKAFFGHKAPFGLYHMPIFGGLTKYVIVKVGRFKNHWHVGWKGSDSAQIHRLKLHNDRVMLLAGKGKWYVHAFDDEMNQLPITIVRTGYLGDHRYNKYIRLF